MYKLYTIIILLNYIIILFLLSKHFINVLSFVYVIL